MVFPNSLFRINPIKINKYYPLKGRCQQKLSKVCTSNLTGHSSLAYPADSEHGLKWCQILRYAYRDIGYAHRVMQEFLQHLRTYLRTKIRIFKIFLIPCRGGTRVYKAFKKYRNFRQKWAPSGIYGGRFLEIREWMHERTVPFNLAILSISEPICSFIRGRSISIIIRIPGFLECVLVRILLLYLRIHCGCAWAKIPPILSV